ncbi:hypothetical protein BD408DRAFT_414532, partial [Parasitella parasitica]
MYKKLIDWIYRPSPKDLPANNSKVNSINMHSSNCCHFAVVVVELHMVVVVAEVDNSYRTVAEGNSHLAGVAQQKVVAADRHMVVADIHNLVILVLVLVEAHSIVVEVVVADMTFCNVL